MSDLIDWGNLIELYRECNKPIRKDENRFYEFSSTVYMNFGAIIKERESQAKRIAELEQEVSALRMWPSRYWHITKNMNMGNLADYDDELASEVREARNEAHKIVFGVAAIKEQQ